MDDLIAITRTILDRTRFGYDGASSSQQTQSSTFVSRGFWGEFNPDPPRSNEVRTDKRKNIVVDSIRLQTT